MQIPRGLGEIYHIGIMRIESRLSLDPLSPMIYKELDPFLSDDKFAKSGRAAEEQMAFYLKRFFDNDPDILVLNGIRLEANGDAAQVDHLVIHPNGVVIVESKSVHGKVQIKDDGQWIRWFNGNQSKGIRSPVTQARMQERFFRDVLGKASNNPALFEKLPFDLLVAISDDGVILWPQTGPVAGVCKADQVADKILEIKGSHSASGGTQTLSPLSRQKMAAFLVASNKPLLKKEVEAPEALPVVPQAPIPEAPQVLPVAPDASGGHVCKHCGSNQLEIRYGFSYYFFCLACEKNSPTNATCTTCQQPAKIRKQKKEFFSECAACNTSTTYYVNP